MCTCWYCSRSGRFCGRTGSLSARVGVSGSTFQSSHRLTSTALPACPLSALLASGAPLADNGASLAGAQERLGAAAATTPFCGAIDGATGEPLVLPVLVDASHLMSQLLHLRPAAALTRLQSLEGNAFSIRIAAGGSDAAPRAARASVQAVQVLEDARAMEWIPLAPAPGAPQPTPRMHHSLTTLPSAAQGASAGRVLLYGGWNGIDVLDDLWQLQRRACAREGGCLVTCAPCPPPSSSPESVSPGWMHPVCCAEPRRLELSLPPPHLLATLASPRRRSDHDLCFANPPALLNPSSARCAPQ